MLRMTATLTMFLVGVTGASAECTTSSTPCNTNEPSVHRDNRVDGSPAPRRADSQRHRRAVTGPSARPQLKKKLLDRRIIFDAPLEMPDYYGKRKSRNSLPDY